MLTAAQVKQYKAEGYCVCHGLLSQEEVAQFIREIDAICADCTLVRHDSSRLEMEPNQGPEGMKVRRIYEPCTYYESFRQFSQSPKLLDCVEELLGPDVIYFQSKVNMKSAEIGSVVEWHQDMAYGPLTNSSTLALLLYLDDADLQNGCLQVLPGRYPMFEHSREGFFQGRITEWLDTSKAVPVEGKQGTGIFFSGLVPHVSAPNSSARSRRTLILGYRAADAFPIHLGEVSIRGEQFVRVVRGQRSNLARFDMDSIYIPHYPAEAKSLYELQDLSRRREAAPAYSSRT